MMHLSSALVTDSFALDVLVDLLLDEELSQSFCENARYCLKDWLRLGHQYR